MLTTGSIAAPSACLRCQLRQVIFRTRRSTCSPCLIPCMRPRSQGFSAFTRRCQESDEAQVYDSRSSRNGKDKVSEYPLGRIIGKPGRRQREGSARLKIDAMQKPFDVVVLRDVVEPKQPKQTALQKVSNTSSETGTIAGQIASEITAQGEEPSLEEVNESIGALRPDVETLDDKAYRDLIKELLHGYNVQQLSSYLTNALKLSSIDGDTVHVIREEPEQRPNRLRRSAWRPGRTPLEQRHAVGTVLKKSEIGTNKSRLAQQIVRLAWNLTVQSEEQQLGELDISLRSWQVAYLFDLNWHQKPMYEYFIDAPLLLRNSDIRPYRPAGIMRVTARRQDAQQIADELERRLHTVSGTKMELDTFKPLLGTRGWPSSLKELFNDGSLREVMRRTMTVIEQSWNGRTLHIFGHSTDARLQARRLVLALLDLPSPGSRTLTVPIGTWSRKADHLLWVFLPEHADMNVHLRHRALTLSRRTVPTRRDGQAHQSQGMTASETEADLNSSSEPVPNLGTRVQSLVTSLSSRRALLPVEEVTTTDEDSYWVSSKAQPWDIQFCKLLLPSSGLQVGSSHYDKQGSTRGRRGGVPREFKDAAWTSVLQPQVSGVGDLLSYFTPKPEPQRQDSKPEPAGTSEPILIAHFMPSPFSASGVKAMERLPRIRVAYRYFKNVKGAFRSSRELHMLGTWATVAEQEARVSLPNEVADLRIGKVTQLEARLDRALNDEQLGKFTHTLRESAISGSGALSGEPTVTFKVPAMLSDKVTGQGKKRSLVSSKDVEVEYLFERFEQVHTTDYVPVEGSDMDPTMREALKGMPATSFLRLKEVDGGLVGGRRTELSLQYDLTDTSISATQIDLPLVEAGLGLVKALTRINAGEVDNPVTMISMYNK